MTKIFKNEDVLNPEYLPEKLPHREGEIREIARNLELIAEGRKPLNLFIYGPPGIGKTATIKYIFREFENYSGIKPIYINCWDFKTSVSILAQITLSLGFFAQRRGWAKDEVLSRLLEALKKTKTNLIIALDEVDQLIYRDQSLLYDLLRINQYVENKIALIFISNDRYIFSKVEPRIKSSLSIYEIEFKPYSFLEMKDILKERADLAFFDYERAIIALCANNAIRKGGDVRVGLECLLKAGRIAERENDSKVRVKHVKKIVEKIEEVKPKLIKEKLNPTEKILLSIIKKSKKPLTVSELYQRYLKNVENPLSQRMIRMYLDHLSQVKLIKIDKKGNLFIIRKR